MTLLLLAAALFAQEDFDRRLDALMPRLAAENLEERDPAVRELNRLVDAAGNKCREALKRRRAAAADATLRSVFEGAIRRLPVLEATIEATGPLTVGKPVGFKIRLKNVSDDDLAVVRSLDGSDVRMRYPYFTAEFRGPDGKLIPTGGIGRCGNINELTAADVKVLKPGEEFDPLGEGSFGLYQLRPWQPPAAGKYEVELTIDYGSDDPKLWNGPFGREMAKDDAVLKLLSRVPKVKLKAKTELLVKE